MEELNKKIKDYGLEGKAFALKRNSIHVCNEGRFLVMNDVLLITEKITLYEINSLKNLAKKVKAKILSYKPQGDKNLLDLWPTHFSLISDLVSDNTLEDKPSIADDINEKYNYCINFVNCVKEITGENDQEKAMLKLRDMFLAVVTQD